MNPRYDNREYYIEGNAARKLNTVPQRIDDRPNRQQREEHHENARISKNRNRARAFDLKYTIALTAATVFLFVSCINMLTIQASITDQRRQIATLESNLNELTDTNDETSKRLESSVDLPKIYEVATSELGMVYPKNGQVISYQASNPDYVKQFMDIPTE